MPNFSDLQSASALAISRERTYWSNLVRQLGEFGEQFVKYLELPSPTFTWKDSERSYVAFTQSNSIGVVRAFDPKDYEKKERSIPFTITVAIPDLSQETIREVSIDLELSSKSNTLVIASAEFVGGGRSMFYRSHEYRSVMDEITNALRSKLAIVC